MVEGTVNMAVSMDLNIIVLIIVVNRMEVSII